MSASDTPLSLTDFRDIYAKADGFCKEVQSFVEEAGIPAMNELRYAGYHLLYAVGDDGQLASASELAKARNHALRATYEAGEAGILCALDRISQFKTDYKNVSVSAVIANYTTILEEAEAAKDRVVADREHSDARNGDHLSLMDTFRTLKSRCHTLDISRDELNKLVRKETREARRFLATILVGIIAIIATVAVFLASRPAAITSENSVVTEAVEEAGLVKSVPAQKGN